MYRADNPRHDPCLPAASPDDTPRPGWPPLSPTAHLVKMPSERLIRAVLSSIDAWIDALDLLYDDTVPGNRAQVLHLKFSMLNSKISFLRLVDASDEEIKRAHAQAGQDTQGGK
jgi:hypothetical protein